MSNFEPSPARVENNHNMIRILHAMGLSKADLTELMVPDVSKSRVDSWMRSIDATKRGSGTTTAARVSRFRAMRDAEFELFCLRLEEKYNAKNQ